MKKTITLTLIALFALLIVSYSPADAQAAEKWDNVRGDGKVSVDTSVKYDGADYSIKIVNDMYTATYASKKFEVKPGTHYRATVMTKYEGYDLMDGKNDSGSAMGEAGQYDKSGNYTGSDWHMLTYEFDSGNDTTHEIALWNGMYAGDCKGTAYYSDFHLEEYTGGKTNEWNVAIVVFKNISAPVKIDGKKTTYKDHLTDSDVSYMSKVTRNIYTSIPALSDNKWKIGAVDTYAIDDTVTELGQIYSDNYMIDFKSKSVKPQLEKIISDAKKKSGRHYDMFIVISPINGRISDKWLGLGGGGFGDARICQLNCKSGAKDYTADPNNQDYPETAMVHEMLHCMETLSRSVDPGNFVQFHANVEEYKNYYDDGIRQKGWGSWGAYHSDYMRCKTPDGRGINAKVYSKMDSYAYALVYGNPDTLQKPARTDIQSLDVKDVSSKTYTGSEIKPDVKIMDGSYRLVKGTDYTLSYQKNTKPGKAAVIITGKGKYAGTYCRTFNIKPKTASVSVSKSGSKYKISWKKITGAYKVQIYVAKKGSSSFKLKTTVKGSSTSAVISASKGDKVKVRSYKRLYPQKYYSSYSKEITLK